MHAASSRRLRAPRKSGSEASSSPTDASAAAGSRKRSTSHLLARSPNGRARVLERSSGSGYFDRVMVSRTRWPARGRPRKRRFIPQRAPHGRRHVFDLDGRHADHLITAAQAARAAVGALPDCRRRGSRAPVPGRVDGGILGTVEGDHRRAERRGEVHGARVTAHHRVARLEERGEIENRSGLRRHLGRAVRDPHNSLRQLPLSRTPGHDATRAAFGVQAPRQRGVGLGRPALERTEPRHARMQRHRARGAEPRAKAARGAARGIGNSQPSPRSLRVDAKGPQQLQVAIDLELLVRRRRHAIRQQPVSLLLRERRREAHAPWRTAQARQQARAEVALGVDADLVARGPQLPQQRRPQPGDRTHAPAPQPAFAEAAGRNPEAVDLWVTGEQTRRRLLHQPPDVSIGTRAPQRVEQGQDVHDVPQRGEPDDEDAARSPGIDGHDLSLPPREYPWRDGSERTAPSAASAPGPPGPRSPCGRFCIRPATRRHPPGSSSTEGHAPHPRTEAGALERTTS